MRMRLLGIPVAALALAACGSDTAPNPGPAHFQLVSGNHQTATAGATALAQPVKGQLYRSRDGVVRFEWLKDALAPDNAYAADTTYNLHVGGITNAVMCWANVNTAPRLIPFAVCSNTTDSGTIAFSVRPDTIAGLARGEVHWDSAGKPLVTAAVDATIKPGPVDSTYVRTNFNPRTSPGTLNSDAVRDHYGNVIAFRIPGDARLTPQDTALGSIGARTVTFTGASVDSTNHEIGLTGATPNVVIARMGYRLVWNGTTPTMLLAVCGVSASPCAPQ